MRYELGLIISLLIAEVHLIAFIRASNRFVYCKHGFQSDAYLGFPVQPSEGGRERQDVTLIAWHVGGHLHSELHQVHLHQGQEQVGSVDQLLKQFKVETMVL